MALRIPGPPWFWTIWEVLSILGLLHSQGLLLSPQRLCSEMASRLRNRLGAPTCKVRVLLPTWAIGTASLFTLGVASGLMCLSSILAVRSMLKPALELVLVLVAPGLVEELIFRVLLLPAAQQGGLGDLLVVQPNPPPAPAGVPCRWPHRWSRQEAAALAIFLLYHLDVMHAGPMRVVFTDLRFLAMAAVLGWACTEAVHLSGSVWPGALMHGTWVWSWIAFAKCPLPP
uniref:CAAX prenyl protease 2/Lysostaphin resistance protein A-like domain-containing protein n=1 Tax=Alexandrium catenella TaxID=2925 RepID=A0A7S1L234_ALECA|mmetsp:Transcript_105096/g.279659  ORF Transcript_105096/g.279659 Transcript_105096/m.279659 type:complete len:229 (+) Transcript_105096:98-784(+)